MAKNNEREVSLESVLWECRVALRGVGTLDKNRDAVISLVFLKFAGDKFTNNESKLKPNLETIQLFWRTPHFIMQETYFILKKLHVGII